MMYPTHRKMEILAIIMIMSEMVMMMVVTMMTNILWRIETKRKISFLAEGRIHGRETSEYISL